jgi:hypothetical protein
MCSIVTRATTNRGVRRPGRGGGGHQGRAELPEHPSPWPRHHNHGPTTMWDAYTNVRRVRRSGRAWSRALA